MKQETKVRSLIRKMVREAMEEGGPGSGRKSGGKVKGTKLSQWADDKKSKEKKYKSEKEFAKSLGLEGGPGSGRLKRGSGQADKMINRAYGLGPKPKKRENPFYGIHGDGFRKSLGLEGGPGSGKKPEGDSDRKPDITMQMADRERGKMITKKDKGTLNKLAKLMKHANEGKLTEQHKLLKQSKLSSAEYQKAKKISGFKTKNYKWNSKQDLYIKESLKKEGKLSDQITIPETDKRAVLQILKKLRLNPGRDYDLGVGKGATFVLDLNKKYQSKVFDLFKKHRVRTHKMWDM